MFKKILVLAVLLRLLIMPFYFHPDIKTYNYQVSHLKDGVLNIYQYIAENKEKLPIKDDFTYFPLTYFSLGGYQLLLSPLLGHHFTNWLTDASSQAAENVGVFRYLFLLKSLYLFLDIAIAFMLTRLFDNTEQKKKAFQLWLFNPFSLLLIYVYSGIDILPVFFMVASLIFIRDQKNLPAAAFLLGIAAAFKGYTILFLPFLLLAGKKLKDRFLIIVAFLAPFFISILPFLFTNGFKEQVLVSGLTNRIFYTGINIGFGETLMLTIVSISVLFFYIFVRNEKGLQELWHYLMALLLILFSTIHYHIEWLLWILPFLVILSIAYHNLSRLAILWLTLSFAIALLYDDKSMTVSLLSAISYLYNLLPTPFVIVRKFYDPYTIQSIIHSVIFGLSTILIWQLFKLEKR